MAPIGHVTVLALQPAARGGTVAPLRVGVLERLAVQLDPARPELVAGGAELGAEVGGDVGGAVVRQRGAGYARPRGGGAGRWSEALMLAHVAARAHHAVPLQRGVEAGVGLEARGASYERRLLRERGMADEAAPRSGRIPARHLHELAGDARAQASRVDAVPPVLILRCVTGAAVRGRERALDRRERRGGVTLGRDRHAPVPLEERLLRRRDRAGRGGTVAGRRMRGGDERQDQAGQQQVMPGPAHQPSVACGSEANAGGTLASADSSGS